MSSLPRPGPVTAICFIWTLVTVFQLYQFSRVMAEVPTWAMFYVIAISAASLAGIAGIWQMKKWGLMVFVGTLAVNQAFALAQGQWHINSLLIPALVIAVGVAHFRQLR